MKRLITAALCALALCGAAAHADGYPSKPIRLIVPFAAGSATDVLGRQLAEGLSPRLKQPIIVEAKPGAGTSVGAQYVANSPADGYTILLGTNATFAVNRILYKQLPYDPLKGFDIVASVGEMPSYLIVPGNSRFNSLADLVTYAKANPGKVTYASSGIGSTGHLVGAMLGHAAGIDLLHVPFKSGPQGLAAVAAGDVDAIFYTSTGALSLIEAGKLKALAVSTDYRPPDLPKVPTIAESGYPGFNFVGWLVFAVPKGTPPAVQATIRDAVLDLQKQPDFKQKLEAIGIPYRSMSPEELQAFVAADQKRMKTLAADTGIQPE
jgi:tripartite-type tricarboxylate transporter receptor subunit TctC